jgi:hypothetical protein
MISLGNHTHRAYFHWLKSLVERPGNQYGYLLEMLFTTVITKGVPNDGNRFQEGIDLRKTYLEVRPKIHRNDELILDDGCSVLELMIALCLRIDSTLNGPSQDLDVVYNWFWILIDNLRLSDARDELSDNMIRSTLHCLVNRCYNSQGEGGCLFPNPNCKYDLRKVEIWYQMMYWLDEYYAI